MVRHAMYGSFASYLYAISPSLEQATYSAGVRVRLWLGKVRATVRNAARLTLLSIAVACRFLSALASCLCELPGRIAERMSRERVQGDTQEESSDYAAGYAHGWDNAIRNVPVATVATFPVALPGRVGKAKLVVSQLMPSANQETTGKVRIPRNLLGSMWKSEEDNVWEVVEVHGEYIRVVRRGKAYGMEDGYTWHVSSLSGLKRMRKRR